MATEGRIRDADPTVDGDAVWAVLEPIFRRGDTYAIDTDISPEDGLAFWFEHPHVRVAVLGGRVLGTYYVGRNHAGNGGHVANCGYAVHEDARGLGLGRLMCADSLDVARAGGFTAVQFNLVVSPNAAALHLWQDFGFEVVGTIPDAFAHPELGLVDAFVMHRRL